jgi:hypothetical protein
MTDIQERSQRAPALHGWNDNLVVTMTRKRYKDDQSLAPDLTRKVNPTLFEFVYVIFFLP